MNKQQAIELYYRACISAERFLPVPTVCSDDNEYVHFLGLLDGYYGYVRDIQPVYNLPFSELLPLVTEHLAKTLGLDTSFLAVT